MNENEAAVKWRCLRATPFGPVATLWSVHRGAPKIVRVLLSAPGAPAERARPRLFPGARAGSCREIDAIADRFEAFLNGEDIAFSLDLVRLDLCPPFQQRVLRAEHGVPRGRVTNYSLLATRAGSPRGARVAGTALATNPFPLVIPCPRAVRSDGALGGYQGGLEMKRALLEMEGVRFRDRKHVAGREFHYGGDGRSIP